ncbi:MAG: YciI family protein [Dehalococcoidales bacterium]|nr:YciI family protein [Dehalococcoidales bacterium]
MFAAIVGTCPDYVERRQAFREEHLARMRRLRDEGKVLLGGAWVDPPDGALIIYQTGSMPEVWALIDNDPYYRAGLWPEVRVREWNVVIR